MPDDVEPDSSRRRPEHGSGDRSDDATNGPPLGFWRKLRRRGLVHLAVVYLGVAWVAIQVVHLFIDRGLLPSWSFHLVLVLLAAGFPVGLVLAWVQDGAADRKGEAAASPGRARFPGPWMHRLARRVDTGHILVVLVALVALLGAGWFLLDDAPPFATAEDETAGWSVMTAAFDPGGGSTPLEASTASKLRHVFDSSVEWILDVPVVGGGPDAGDGPGSLAARLAHAREAGARYLVTGDVFVAGDGERGLTVRVYSTVDGRRLDEMGSGGAEPLSHAAARLATDVAELIVRRERLDVGNQLEVAAATSSPVARVELISAQRHWWRGAYDRAAESFRRAIAADSSFAPAYFRLSWVETFRWDYATALSVVEAGLSRGDALGRKWRSLLQAQRRYVRHEGEEAIRRFQDIVGEYPETVDGWLGLSEALLHYGGVTGRCQVDALPAFEQMIRTDSTFAPTHYHLVHLHLLRGDEERARRQTARIRPLGSPRKAHVLAVELVFGDSAARREALRDLRDDDRFTIASLVFLLTQGSLDLEAADAVAGALLEGSARTPSDRQRGAQYRFVARAAMDRWEAAVDAWRHGAGDEPLDRFVMEAHLAGFPADSLTAPMFEWAETQLEEGEIPDYGLPLEDVRRQGFRALVHRAALEGDSARVGRLLETLDAADLSGARPTDPLPGLARSVLRARLELLSGDTARAVATLQEGMDRVWQVETGFHPLTSMAAERMLLAELELARGRREAGARWLRSLFNTWSLGDALYHPKALRLAARHDLAPPPEQCSSRAGSGEEALIPDEGAEP